MPESLSRFGGTSKSNIHGYIHGICAKYLATPEVLKNLT
jgi:hypothetical protein